MLQINVPQDQFESAVAYYSAKGLRTTASGTGWATLIRPAHGLAAVSPGVHLLLTFLSCGAWLFIWAGWFLCVSIWARPLHNMIDPDAVTIRVFQPPAAAPLPTTVPDAAMVAEWAANATHTA